MPQVLTAIAVGAVVAVVAGVFWRRARAAQLAARRELARLDLNDAGAELAEQFRAAADATGMPRGLRWKSVELGQPRLLAVERATGALYGMVAAEIRFEAIPGGPMEGVEAVGNVRAGAAVFVHRDGAWTSDGQAVFNLGPDQALEHYRETLAPWGG